MTAAAANNGWDMKNEPEMHSVARFKIGRKLADTLQGHIYKAFDNETQKTVVVKQTFIELVRQKMTRDGHPVPEDFENEKRILTMLSDESASSNNKNKNADDDAEDEEPGFVRMIHEWQDQNSYYYAMQFCEGELFLFISHAFENGVGPQWKHMKQTQMMDQKPVKESEANEWMTQIRHIFRQLVKSTAWMHSKGVCHLDQSLENTMIFSEKDLVVKIIDFGLGRQYDPKSNAPNNFKYNKRVGKRGYMAPEVYCQKTYDARKADIWSLGVMLFMMLVGAPPYKKPTSQDAAFGYVLQGRLGDVLRHWKRLRLVTRDALDLMIKIFKVEPSRINMEQLLAHPYIDMEGYLSPELECDGTMPVDECPSVYRTITSLMAIQESGGQLSDQITATYTNVELLNDYNHVMEDHIRKNPQNHERLTKVLNANINHKKCHIQTCQMMRRNFRNKVLDSEKVFARLYGEQTLPKYKFIMLQILDKLHCFFAHSFEIGHKVKTSEYQAYLELEHYSAAAKNTNELQAQTTLDFIVSLDEDQAAEESHANDDISDNTELTNNSAQKPDVILENIQRSYTDNSLVFCKQKFLDCRRKLMDKTNNNRSQILIDIENRTKNNNNKYCTASSCLIVPDLDRKLNGNGSESESKSNSAYARYATSVLDQRSCLNPKLRLPMEYFGDLKQIIINRFTDTPVITVLNRAEFIQFLKDKRTEFCESKKLKKLKESHWNEIYNIMNACQLNETKFARMDKKKLRNMLKQMKKPLKDAQVNSLYKKIELFLNQKNDPSFKAPVKKKFFSTPNFTNRNSKHKNDLNDNDANTNGNDTHNDDRKTEADNNTNTNTNTHVHDSNVLQSFGRMPVLDLVQKIYGIVKELFGAPMRKNFDAEKLLQYFTYYQINGLRFVTALRNRDLIYLINNCLVCGQIDTLCVGFRYNYWSKNLTHEAQKLQTCIINGLTNMQWYVPPKYPDLKAEMMQNRMNPFQFANIVVFVTENLMKTIVCKQLRAVVKPHLNNDMYHSIHHGDKIPASRLVSLFIYTNYDFITARLVESYVQGPAAHEAFANIARYLRETIDCFGVLQQRHACKYFYHVVERTLLIPGNALRFCNLVSTTSEFNFAIANLATFNDSGVAALAADDNNGGGNVSASASASVNGHDRGVILAVSNAEDRNRCFDVYWFSDTNYENETIFMGGLNCHRIVSIRDLGAMSSADASLSVSENVRNYEQFVSAMTGLQHTIAGLKYKTLLKMEAERTRSVSKAMSDSNSEDASESESVSVNRYEKEDTLMMDALKILVQYRLENDEADVVDSDADTAVVTTTTYTSALPLYLRRLFDTFCDSIRHWVTIDMNILMDNSVLGYVFVDVDEQCIRYPLILSLFCHISKIVIGLDGDKVTADNNSSVPALHPQYVLNENLIEFVTNFKVEKWTEFRCIEFKNVSPQIQKSELFATQSQKIADRGWTMKYDEKNFILQIQRQIPS